MVRFLLSLVVASFLAAPIFADDASRPEPPRPTAADRLKADPNDALALNELLREGITAINGQLEEEQFAGAEKTLAALKANLEAVKPTEDDAKARLASTARTITAYQDQIDLARTPLADIEKRLDADADDIAAVVKYGRKVMETVYAVAPDEPAKATELIKSAKARLEKVSEAAEEAPVKRQVAMALRNLASLEARVQNYEELLGLVGKSAAPMHEELEGWVNGTPLTDVDLKGKVVLLDFWAIWCGPCILTFPHLREWNEKYADKGLVMIGLTRYYDFQWDDAAGGPTRSKEKVTAEVEQEMLRKFAEHHSLHHRFAIQKKDGSLDSYYKVQGIPHVVVIDQEGKIRLVRVGSGSRNAKKIDALLQELLGDKTAAAKNAETK